MDLQEVPEVCNGCCDPIRLIVEAELCPCLSHVLTREGWLRLLRMVRVETCMCIDCGCTYRYMWREAAVWMHRLRRSLMWISGACVYTCIEECHCICLPM